MSAKLANDGGTPMREAMLPYGRQWLDETDVQAVVEVLRSDWLTTGPKVAEFEKAIADFVGAKDAVAVSSGTAALHASMFALDIGPGDEVIVPPMTFAATANCVVFQGGTPVFADVDLDTLLLDPLKAEERITEKTKAIIAVDYAGQPCDYDRLREIAKRHHVALVADGCHALGAEYKGRKVGSLADMTVFSFHPVKHITTGEGGMVTTDNEEYAERMRLFRTHGITRDAMKFICSDSSAFKNGQRTMDNGQQAAPAWFYEMVDLGYNYRITDIQCALGLSQLQKLPKFLERRREIAALYDEVLADVPGIEPLGLRADVLTSKQSAMRPAPCSTPSKHAYHLYVVKVDFEVLGMDRNTLFQALRKKGIGVNVHYIPVHLHPYYEQHLNTRPGDCPVAEAAYKRILTLPIFPVMSQDGVDAVITEVSKVAYDCRLDHDSAPHSE